MTHWPRAEDDHSNPSVNRYLADEALDHVDHALGRPTWPHRESYRNFFTTEPDGDLARGFAASPWWKEGVSIGRLQCFLVTESGRKALAEHLAALKLDRVFIVAFEGREKIIAASTGSKARYDCYFEIRDVLPDLNFLDFARRSRVRRVT